MGKNLWPLNTYALKEESTKAYFYTLYDNDLDFCLLVTYPLPEIPGIPPKLTIAIPQRSAYLIHVPGAWQPYLTTYKKLGLKYKDRLFYSYDVSDTDSRPRKGSSGGMVFHANYLVGLHKGEDKIVSMVEIVKFLTHKNFKAKRMRFEYYVSTCFRSNQFLIFQFSHLKFLTRKRRQIMQIQKIYFMTKKN